MVVHEGEMMGGKDGRVYKLRRERQEEDEEAEDVYHPDKSVFP